LRELETEEFPKLQKYLEDMKNRIIGV
jgi:hypothetical protein